MKFITEAEVTLPIHIKAHKSLTSGSGWNNPSRNMHSTASTLSHAAAATIAGGAPWEGENAGFEPL